MRHYVYIENNSAAWVDISDRCGKGFGSITWKFGKDGQGILSPATEIEVDNSDNWWITEPEAGGDFSGAWEGRRVKFTRSASGQPEESLGIFRITPEYGFVAQRNKFGSLKLESLSAELKRQDAADVSHGRGWLPNSPWPVCADRLRQPNDTSTLTLPNAPISFENAALGCSSIGRPGDYTADGHDIDRRALAVDQVYNESAAVFAYLTTSADIWEYSRVTGQWSEVTNVASIPSDHHALRIFWRRTSTGTGYYVILTAPAETGAYYHPRLQTSPAAWTGTLWRHDQQDHLSTLNNPVLAPAMYRAPVQKLNSTNAPGLGSADHRIIIGNENYAYDDTTPPYTSYCRENICIPFDQYPFSFATRAGTRTETDWIKLHRVKVGDGWQRGPLAAIKPDSDLSWTQAPLSNVPESEKWRDSEIRAGRGYYSWALCDEDSPGAWDAGIAWNYKDCAVRYTIGQGPLFDLSYEHTGAAGAEDTFWFAHARYASGKWYVLCTFFDGTTAHGTQVKDLGYHEVPTFITCDITRPNDYTGRKGAVIFGSMDYGHLDTSQRLGAGSGYYYATISKLNVFPVVTAPDDDHPTFTNTGGETVIEFCETGAQGDNRRCYTTKTGGYTHLSGRWSPLAMGFRRYNTSISGDHYSYYNAVLMCLDRNEIGPTYCPGNYEDSTHERDGSGTYRLLYVKIKIRDNSAIEPTVDAVSITDTYGPGYDIKAKSPLPWMGFTRICEGDDGDELTNNLTNRLYCFSVADGAVYEMDPAAVAEAYCRPIYLDSVPHSDSWFGMGTIAVGNEGGDITKPILAGVSHPVFPTSSSEQWPDGLYYGWIFDSLHSGRIPLLENKSKTRLDALALVTSIGDARYFIDRAAQGILKKYPDTASAALTIHSTDCGGISRSMLPIVNSATRSVNDIIPGKTSVSVSRTANSRFAANPTFSGLGIYPVDLLLKCIGSGLATSATADESNPLSGMLCWAWKMTAGRIQTSLALPYPAGSIWVLQLADGAGLEAGDKVTLSQDDESIEIIAASGNSVFLTAPLSVSALPAGTPVFFDKGSAGKWSHQLRWDDIAGEWKGIGTSVFAADAGATELSVQSLDPFSRGTIFQIHSRDGLDSENYSSAWYRVTRCRTTAETGTLPVIEFYSTNADRGLVDAIPAFSPITTFINLPPIGLSQVIGQSGITFSLTGTTGGTPEDETASPVSEGDIISASFPGLISKKNEHSKITAINQNSITTYGTRITKLVANPYLDAGLAAIDVNRTVRRGKAPLVELTLSGVRMADPADHTALIALNLWDIVSVTDEFYLATAAAFSAPFLVVAHVYNSSDDTVDVRLQEWIDPEQPCRKVSVCETGLEKVAAQIIPGDTENLLTWARTLNVGSYGGLVIRSSTTGYPLTATDGEAVASKSSTDTDHTHTGLVNGTTYFYSLFTTDGAGVPKYSARVTLQATPSATLSAPTAAAATTGDGEITLSWTDPAGDNLEYIEIRYRTDGTTPTATTGTLAARVSLARESVVISGLTNGQTYWFGIFAVNYAGEFSTTAATAADADFDPSEFGSVSLRLTAHDLILSKGLSNGNDVDEWDDTSGNSNDFEQYLTQNCPEYISSDSDYNNLPVVSFDHTNTEQLAGAAAFDLHSNANGIHIFLVAEVAAVGYEYAMVSQYQNGIRRFYVVSDNFLVYEDDTGAAYSLEGQSPALNTPYLFEFIWYPSTTAQIYHNGTFEGDDDDDAPASVDTGGSLALWKLACRATSARHGSIKIAEWTVFDEVLTGDNLSNMREKLRSKFALNLTPPAQKAAFSSAFSADFDTEE